ncbi:hypothetical protein IW136_002629 [Coemansia sp. RSA 678]|nr:hypothetical protein IW136_002629 [Coemansia sp. RSA 678]
MDIREITDSSLFNDKQRTHHCTWSNCLKSFTRKSDLKRHYRIHTNEKPYGCTYAGCNKHFVQKSALTVHLRTHSGEKPHRCKEPGCDKRFSDSSSLARHRHTHSGKRTYLCSFSGCNKQFYTKSAYNSHHRCHMDSITHAPLSPQSLSSLQGSSSPRSLSDMQGFSSPHTLPSISYLPSPRCYTDSELTSCPPTPPLHVQRRRSGPDAFPELTLTGRATRSATVSSDSDDSSCASPTTPLLGRTHAMPLGVLPSLQYLGVLSKAACAQAPLPLSATFPLLRPALPQRLHDRSTLPQPSGARYTPY